MNEPNQDLMQRITTALETAPVVQVPADFAARVAARVPQAKRRRLVVPSLRPARYGHFATLTAMLVLLAAVFVFAPHIRNSILCMVLEAVLFVELGALVLWFGWLRRVR
jgi:hypothetical protein